MANDWIKIEKSTPDKPEIARLARKLGVPVADAFLSMVRIYSWADTNSADGIVPNLSPQDVDTLARAVPGTCEALAAPEIGWVEIIGGSIRFLKWDRHNGTSAKQRLYEREKKRRQRSVSPDCPRRNGTTVGTKRGPREREEREKKLSPNGDNPLTPLDAIEDLELRKAIESWLTYKAEKRQGYKPQGLRELISLAIERRDQHGTKAVVNVIKRAIANDWKGWDQESSFHQNGVASNGKAKSTSRIGPGQRYQGD